jgi:hypothetical protein
MTIPTVASPLRVPVPYGKATILPLHNLRGTIRVIEGVYGF